MSCIVNLWYLLVAFLTNTALQKHAVCLVGPFMSMWPKLIRILILMWPFFYQPWSQCTSPSPVLALHEPQEHRLLECQPNPHQTPDYSNHILINMSERVRENKGQERVVMSAGDVNLCPHSGAAISSLHLIQKYTNRYVESWRIYSVFLGDKGTFF